VPQCKKLFNEATQFLLNQVWCERVISSYEGLVVEGVIGVFLFNLVPATSAADHWIWIVVGDLPPAYIAVVECPNPACALDAYIGAMEQWVNAIKAQASTAELIPVSAPPTLENALALEKRLNFLDTRILIDYQEDLIGPSGPSADSGVGA
jgi:hypothetical protein